MQSLNLSGCRFGMLVALRKGESVGSQSRWICICDCGAESLVRLGNLRNGHTTSCGCKRVIATAEDKTRHGHFGTPTYKSWSSMLTRCQNKGNHKYLDYGGRGIKVHDSWKNFESFLADMGERREGTTLGRIDNDGDYKPGNCEWQDSKTQARNKRNTALFDFEGKSATLQEHCEAVGMHYPTAKSRIYLYGWTVDKALTTPTRQRK